MRETKRELMPLYSYYDRTGIAAHLTDMAAKGWMLENLGAYSWRYRRSEPKKLRFAVTFFPAASQFDPGPSQGLETYRDYCAAAGWVLAADTAQVQIFYNEDENAVPIETDPAAEYANIRRCMKKSFLASYWALLAVSLLQVLFTLWRVWTDPVGTLSSTASLSVLLDWLPLDLVLIWELARYYRWQRRAKAAAESGAPLPDLRSVRWLGVLILVWTCGVLLWLLASYWNSRGMFLLKAGMALYMFLMIFLSLAAKDAMKHLRFPRWANIAVTYGMIIVLTVGGMAGMMALIFRNGSGWLDGHQPVEVYEYRGMTWEVYNDDIPLRIEDLTDTDYACWSTEARTSETVLVSFREYTQRPRMDALKEPDLDYDIVEVKAPFLYGICKKGMLERYWFNDPEEYRSTYRPIDAAPWGAAEAYQLYHFQDSPSARYLLCWEDRIVEIRFDETPTAAQMALAGSILKAA